MSDDDILALWNGDGGAHGSAADPMGILDFARKLLAAATARCAIGPPFAETVRDFELDREVRAISAGVGALPPESPIVPDPFVDCACGRHWRWDDGRLFSCRRGLLPT